MEWRLRYLNQYGKEVRMKSRILDLCVKCYKRLSTILSLTNYPVQKMVSSAHVSKELRCKIDNCLSQIIGELMDRGEGEK